METILFGLRQCSMSAWLPTFFGRRLKQKNRVGFEIRHTVISSGLYPIAPKVRTVLHSERGLSTAGTTSSIHSCRDAMPNVLIVDDQPAVRKALRRFFEDTHWAECSEAVDGCDAIEKARQLNPDVILLDLSMPVMNGIEAARTLKQIKPQVPILMLTAHFGTATDLLAKESGFPQSSQKMM